MDSFRVSESPCSSVFSCHDHKYSPELGPLHNVRNSLYPTGNQHVPNQVYFGRHWYLQEKTQEWQNQSEFRRMSLLVLRMTTPSLWGLKWKTVLCGVSHFPFPWEGTKDGVGESKVNYTLRRIFPLQKVWVLPWDQLLQKWFKVIIVFLKIITHSRSQFGVKIIFTHWKSAWPFGFLNFWLPFSAQHPSEGC